MPNSSTHSEKWKIGQKKLYDLWAQMPKTKHLSQFWEFYGDFKMVEITLLGEIVGKLVLETGCRDGRFIRVLVSEGAHVVGIDISRACIKLARQGIPRNAKDKTHFVVCDAEKLPFHCKSFDCVTVLFLLHHLPSFSLIEEVYRVLKKAGILLLDEPVRNNPIMAFGRKIYPLILSSIRVRACQDIEDGSEYAPERNPFTIGELQKVLNVTNFRIIRKNGQHLFLFPLEYLIRLLPLLRFCLTDEILFGLFRIETTLLKRRSFQDFCRVVTIKCVK